MLIHTNYHALQKLSAQLINQAMHMDELHITPDMPLSDIICQLHAHSNQQQLRQQFIALEAALCQLELGLYGLCADCEDPIEDNILSKNITAQRCYKCDIKNNHQHRQELRLDDYQP